MLSANTKLQTIIQNAELLYDLAAINKGLDRMAAAITERLHASNPLVLCVLQGALIATGHLLTRLEFPLTVDYVHLTRYRSSLHGGDVHWLATPQQSLQGRTVLVVDDVFDTGITLTAIKDYCQQAGAAAIYTAVVVSKIGTQKPHVDFTPDFSALESDDRYIFGFGLDYEEYGRNLRGIYAVK